MYENQINTTVARLVEDEKEHSKKIISIIKKFKDKPPLNEDPFYKCAVEILGDNAFHDEIIPKAV